MKKIIFSLVITSVFISCSNQQSSFSNGGVNVTENSKLSAVLWQQTAAEYDALCLQAFNSARYQLSTSAPDMVNKSGKKQAIVLDLDETVLNNSPYNGWLIKNNASYSQETWSQWVNMSAATVIPGAAEFIDFARANGFAVFFISNRSVELLEPTIANLANLGIDVDPSNVLLKSNTSSKIIRRKEVLANYNIVMLIGDNLADFNDQFDEELDIATRKLVVQKYSEQFGAKFIVLPNAMYGNWESALKLKNEEYLQKDSYGPQKFLKGF